MDLTPDDQNIGWFAGRISLDLTGETFIENVFVNAESVSDPAVMRTKIQVRNNYPGQFHGNAVIKIYPWFPDESVIPSSTISFPLRLMAWDSGVLDTLISISSPRLWTYDNPNLYKIEVLLQDELGMPVDDNVITSGIRTVSQEAGIFRINGNGNA
jgi:beta-galactosidase/beta-glucuronidase